MFSEPLAKLKNELKWKHVWEQRAPWCFRSTTQLCILRIGRIGSPYTRTPPTHTHLPHCFIYIWIRILFCALISCARVLLMCVRFDTIYTPYLWSSSELKHKYPDRVSRTGAPKYFLIIVNAVLSVTIEIGLKWSHCRALAKCRDIFSFLKIWARLWLGEGAHTLWPDPIKILYELSMNSLMNNS